ncbi:hypothetical protein FH972_021610 [Carpinus fangiana]|uniref:Uncharacterized protein n=1 Tax=Carpinus fangiana TaxID=176857 RepID=A0A5N6KQD9_9ROSI|nr:hypothetical protein FH972_021610 [Carpinus fangiana]
MTMAKPRTAPNDVLRKARSARDFALSLHEVDNWMVMMHSLVETRYSDTIQILRVIKCCSHHGLHLLFHAIDALLGLDG